MPLPVHRQKGSCSKRRGERPGPTHLRNDSASLSPVSVFHYSETEPFLPPTDIGSSPPSPLSPDTAFRRPPTLTPSTESDREYGREGSWPVRHNLRAGTRPSSHVRWAPSAKLARRSTWLAIAAGLLLTLSVVFIAPSSGPSSSGLSAYGSAATGELAKLVSWRDSAIKVEQSKHTLPEYPSSDQLREIPIIPLPRPRSPDLNDPDAKYLGFLPHSGFHNQRIALQNALLLGKVLNRKVLIPPVWIGWPISTQYYQELRQSWLHIMLTNPTSFNLSTLAPDSPLNQPATFPSSAALYPCPTCTADNSTLLAELATASEAKLNKWRNAGYDVRPDGYPIIPGLQAEDCKSYSPECRFTYRDTFLAWDFLVDLDEAARTAGVEVVDRWDLRERTLMEQLGVEERDVYVLEDREVYDFRFSDRTRDDTMLINDNLTSSHYKRTVSIAALAQLDHKVVLLGSLFGTGRVRLYDEPHAHEWVEALGRAMAFRNAWLLDPAEAIVARLGGPANFVGVHARVGDGEFARHAKQNMECVWRSLVVEELGVEEKVADEMWEKVKPNVLVGRASRRRASPPSFAVDTLNNPMVHVYARKEERGLLDEIKSWLPFFRADEPSSRLRNLTCRAPLHPESRFKGFNVPLYLATDARVPEQDVNLRPFFDAFPCTFVLGDFDRADPERNDGLVVDSINRMGKLVNGLDGVPLGRLFLPFLEAIVAAKARIVIGTEHSTFSAFASTSLHDAYWAE